jgi:hypothetical protein
MRSISVITLCVISAAVGAGIDHYWDKLPSFTRLDWNRLPPFARSNAPTIEQTKVNPSGVGGVEVLGDRVRCDVRYQELKLPESEYRAFFDKCMGNTASTGKSE